MMNEPIRLRLKKAVAAAIEEIATTEGYWLQANPEIGERLTVMRDVAAVGSNDQTPCITLIESPEEKEIPNQPEATGQRKRTLALIIQGFADPSLSQLLTGNIACVDIADWLRADVKMRLTKEMNAAKNTILGTSRFFGSDKVTDMWFTGGSVRPPEQSGDSRGADSRFAYFWFVLCLDIVEDDARPYD